MNEIFRHIFWVMKGVKVYALVGKSGTGKSFRAKLLTQKHNIPLIIDDGLLIKDNKILAGKSAKKEPTFLGAIKTALFDETEHREEVKKVLEDEKFRSILLIGTSEKMVKKITSRLGLPSITKTIQIEDIASTAEIQTAIHSRRIEGKHIIPVPVIEVNRNYSQLMYDSIKIFMKRKLPFRKGKVFEKTVVQPEFGKKGKVTISEAALTQMVLHCADEFDQAISIKKVSMKTGNHGYKLNLDIHIPFGVQLSGNIHNFKEYVTDNLERYTGILIESINVNIVNVSPNRYKKRSERI